MKNIAGNNLGFTLIDMAIMLTVVGLLMVPVIQEYEEQTKPKRKDNTVITFQSAIKPSIENFFFENDRFPCPADITLPRDDPNYGHEACGGAGPVLIGAVPFATIRVPELSSLDGWSNRITYAVTAVEANAPFAATGLEAVRQKSFDKNGNEVAYLDAHYVLISHGENGTGGYSHDGVLVSACPADTVSREAENCDGDDLFIVGDLSRSHAGDTFYDDYSFSQDSAPNRIWVPSEDDPDDIVSTISKIGIGNDNPEAHLDVTGNILAADGNLDAGLICDNAGKCFQAGIIGGTGIDCGTGSAMTGIGNADAECDRLATANTPGTCATGELVQGIQPNGDLICVAPP